MDLGDCTTQLSRWPVRIYSISFNCHKCDPKLSHTILSLKRLTGLKYGAVGKQQVQLTHL